jgi:hypothetical protein
MKKNMGNADRIIRLIVAIVIGGLYFGHVINGTVAIVLEAVALIFLITSLFSFCPLYLPFGIKTCNTKKN